MKNIMFNDQYGLTHAVLEGRKTQTRRIITTNLYNRVDWKAFEEGNYDCVITDDASTATDIRDYAAYRVGEEVAVAQNYHDAHLEWLYKNNLERAAELLNLSNEKGWRNKMFVRSSLMPYRIHITNVRVERLQDISEEDCLQEGVIQSYNYCQHKYLYGCSDGNKKIKIATGAKVDLGYDTAQEAFSYLIDKTCGCGTWDSKPYVFVYDFELEK